jgi:hypothetical protein
VTVVARVLLDRVQVDPPEVAIGATPRKRHDVIETHAGHRPACCDDLAPVGVQVDLGVATSMSLKSLVFVSLGEVQIGHMLASRTLTKPPALDVGQVPNQPLE